MNKIFLISLLANVILGYLYWKESSRPAIERSIIESHEEPRVVEKKIYIKVPAKTRSQKTTGTTSTASAPEPHYMELDPKEYEQTIEKVSTDRESYLTEKLELAPEDLQKIEKVKKDFYQEADKLILGEKEPTIEQRRQLLDLEASREEEFARVMGREKWEKFKKYREDYNQKNYKRQMDEDSPLFIPMDI